MSLKTKNNLNLKIILTVLTVAYAVFVSLYKLDAEFMFTDEILYIQAGREYLSGDYTLNLQHPLIGKFLSATTSTFSNEPYLLRLPFALVGIFSALFVYMIIKIDYNYKIALFGSILYVSLPFLNYTNRSVLLESPMHLFWLLCIYFLLKFAKFGIKRNFYMAMVLFGLSMSVKYTSLVLTPSLLWLIIRAKNKLKRSDILFAMAVCLMVFMLQYIHMVLIHGPDHLIFVARSAKDVFLSRNSSGKIHVVDGKIYNYSPWWYYIHYFVKFYGPFYAGMVFLLSLLGLVRSKKHNLFWVLLLVSSVVFFQFQNLKNYRYLASVEVPLVFLIISAVAFIREKYGKLYLASLFLIPLTLFHTFSIKPTAYHAAYIFLSEATRNFTDGKRVLIFGSFRSSKWYFNGHKARVVIRKDIEPIKGELPSFSYFLVDNTERLKDPHNVLFRYLDEHLSSLEVRMYDNLTLYYQDFSDAKN